MAATTTSTPNKQYILSATYTSPTNKSFRLVRDIPAPPAENSVEDKTRYLNQLRQAIIVTQDQMNKELTARMEEDTARESNGAQATAVDDAKEEENYGEEVVEEED